MSKTVPTHTEGQRSRQTPSASDEARNSERLNFNHVDSFAEHHRLTHHLDTFRQAAALLLSDSDVDNVPGLSAPEVQALHDEGIRKWRQPRMFYFTVLVCSIGAIEQGWAQTGMNGANLYFPQAFGIGSDSKHDNFVVGLINSGIYLSTGLLGAWLSDPINNRLGRRGAVFVGSVLCLIANFGSSLSRTWPQLLFFRFVLGAGLGINASTVSVYAAECAPAAIRGGIAVSWQMWVAFGIFMGFVANAAAYSYGADAWRWQLAGPVIPTVPLLIMLHLCPESPAWYIKNERYQEAFQSLYKLRNTELQAARDVYSTYLQRRAQKKVEESESPSFVRKIMELVTIPRIRRATTASYVVMLSQQLCGINIIAFYSSTIFAQAGFSMLGALVASCVFGFVNFIGAFPAIWTMDSLGRRSLLLLTLPLMALTMLFAGLSFSIPPENAAHFGLLATLIYLFCALYSPGMGPVPNTYSAEVFPLSHREVGMSFAVATANFWAAVLSLTFPGFVTALGSQGAFVLYAVLNILALVLVFLFVPETKQKTLDELDGVFSVSTRTFVKYQTTEYLPWFAKRYILRQKEAELKPPAFGEEYERLVGQDDDDDDATS
ncbi:MFS transporter [Exophiala viscosa]|uniref:MFS transporter n=1 Tax=Exophiala viscosa TaxID=2486360 RepID=UPI002191AE98|nr:MFS transporter [Exophiala viscosa]